MVSKVSFRNFDLQTITMSEKKKGIQEGPPIWVESLMTPEEHKECNRKYPATVQSPTPLLYDASRHKGGKWRNGMGSRLSDQEIINSNKVLDSLLKKVGVQK